MRTGTSWCLGQPGLLDPQALVPPGPLVPPDHQGPLALDLPARPDQLASVKQVPPVQPDLQVLA